MPQDLRTVVDRPAQHLAGLGFYGDPIASHAGWTEENEIGRLWRRLIAYLTDPRSPFEPPAVSYELHLRDAQSEVTGEFEVFAGFEVPEGTVLPVDLSLKVVPADRYAMVEVHGDQIVTDWPDIQEWLADSGLAESGSFVLMRYDERFLGVDRIDESVMTVLIPVRPIDARR